MGMGHLLATRPLETIAIDFTILQPASDGKEDVLVITDVLTKFTQPIPTRVINVLPLWQMCCSVSGS